MESLEVSAARHEAQFVSPTDKLAEELVSGGSPLAVRDAILRIRELEHDKDDLGKTITAIAERYRVKGERIDHEIAQLRSSVEVYLQRFSEDGKASFPDAGTAYLQTVKQKVNVVDKGAFEEWARERGYTVEAVDTTSAKKAVLETGEAAPGVEIEPATTAVRIRGA